MARFRFQTSKGMQCAFRFHYPPPDQQHNIATTATVELDGKQSSCGLALCSESDNFCRRIGRKVALARALKNAGLNKPDRARAWSAYFANTNDLKNGDDQ